MKKDPKTGLAVWSQMKAIRSALDPSLPKVDHAKVCDLARSLALELRDQSARIAYVRDLALKISAANQAGKRDENLERALASMVLQIEVPQ